MTNRSRPSSGLLVVFCAGFVGVLLSASGAFAASSPVEQIANYSGPDRQARLEAGAKKEGEVLVYTTGTQTQPVFDAFAKLYPFIRVEIFRASNVDVTRRMLEEQKAGRLVADAIDLNTGGLHILLDQGILQPFATPDMNIYKPESIEPGRHWVLDYESYLNLGYNTKALAEADVPQTYDDLLDPKWKGKMAVSSRGTTLTNWVGAIVLERGPDFIKKLSQQDLTVYKISGRGLSNLVVSGEASLSPVIYSSHMANSKARGAHVGWRALGPLYATIGAAALIKTSPHPHTGMLMVDFLLSQEGQKIRQSLGYATARRDMQNPEKPDKIYYLSERPNYAAEVEQWGSLVRQYFGKVSAPPAGFVDSGED